MRLYGSFIKVELGVAEGLEEETSLTADSRFEITKHMEMDTNDGTTETETMATASTAKRSSRSDEDQAIEGPPAKQAKSTFPREADCIEDFFTTL